MARVTVEDCLEKVDNRFSLILLAAKRAKQLLSGSKLLIPETDNKAIVNALREIAAGKVRYMTEEDLRLRREREDAEREAALAAAAKEEEMNPAAIEVASPEADSVPASNGNGIQSVSTE